MESAIVRNSRHEYATVTETVSGNLNSSHDSDHDNDYG